MNVSLRARMSLLTGSAVVLCMLAGCGSSSKTTSSQASTAKTTQQSIPTSTTNTVTASTPTAAGVVTGTSGTVTATLHAGTSHPHVNQAWPISFTVSNAGRPAKASVSYEYLFAGQVVAHRSHYTFTGHFADVFRWPSSAVGYPLTFRAVIVSGGATINLDYPVQVVA
jgi:hypothetical protein